MQSFAWTSIRAICRPRAHAGNAPICLKPGSWPVLAVHRPDLEQCPLLERFGQTIRYLPPCGSAPARPMPLGRLVFPRYQPGSVPHAEPLTPEQALQAIIEAEAVIRNLTQSKLEALARWVGSVPAHAITYPDLASGLALVANVSVVEASSASPSPTRG